MAAQSDNLAILWLKRIGRGIAWVALSLGALTAAFVFAAWAGSSIPRNADWTEPDAGITIMVETNGTHTGIVMPIVSSEFDWRTIFPAAARPRDDGRIPTHISIGWGEREVFLNTPTWGDLKASTAARVVFLGGDALMRVSHYAHPGPSPYHRPLRVRESEYRALVERVLAALPKAPASEERPSYSSFERHALLYDAMGRYTLANTCNQWVGDVLAEAGVKMGAWTPLAGGVMKWIPEPAETVSADR